MLNRRALIAASAAIPALGMSPAALAAPAMAPEISGATIMMREIQNLDAASGGQAFTQYEGGLVDATLPEWTRKIEAGIAALQAATAAELAALDHFEAIEPTLPEAATFHPFYRNWGMMGRDLLDERGELVWKDGIPARIVDAAELRAAMERWPDEPEFLNFLRPRLVVLEAYDASHRQARDASGASKRHSARMAAETRLHQMVCAILDEDDATVGMVLLAVRAVRALGVTSDLPSFPMHEFAGRIIDRLALALGAAATEEDNVGESIAKRRKRLPVRNYQRTADGEWVDVNDRRGARAAKTRKARSEDAELAA